MRVYVLHQHTNFEVLRPYRLEDMAHFHFVCLPVTLTFDLLILKLVCELHLTANTCQLPIANIDSKTSNLPSKFGHTRPLGSRIIRYVRDGRTDRQKQRLLLTSLRVGA